MKPLTDKQMKQIIKMIDDIENELEYIDNRCYISIKGGDKYTTHREHIRLYTENPFCPIQKENEYMVEYTSDTVAFDSMKMLVIEEDQIYAVKQLIEKALHKYTVEGYYCGGEPNWVNYDPNTYSYIIEGSDINDNKY